jgi:adenylate cyclase
MEIDEHGTHEHYISHRRDLIDPLIFKHRGRIVKSTGDGLLAEFKSVADCLCCAVKVQEGMASRNREKKSARPIEFRIGINFGSVIVEEDDVYGDGVNIAARIPSLAYPGGIAISSTATQEMGLNLDIDVDDLGPLVLKNMARPVRVFRYPSARRRTDVSASCLLPATARMHCAAQEETPDHVPLARTRPHEGQQGASDQP